MLLNGVAAPIDVPELIGAGQPTRLPQNGSSCDFLPICCEYAPTHFAGTRAQRSERATEWASVSLTKKAMPTTTTIATISNDLSMTEGGAVCETKQMGLGSLASASLQEASTLAAEQVLVS
jgi:hypothetical protein